MERRTDATQTILRCDPLAEFNALRAWPLSARRRFATHVSREAVADLPWSPRVDVYESDETYSLVVEVPGIEPDHIAVESHEYVLTVKGEKKEDVSKKDDRHHKLGRRFGAFSRSFKLPKDADEDSIRATHKNGVLTIEVSKAPAAQPKVVAIDS
jgi:HSP20 family protein